METIKYQWGDKTWEVYKPQRNKKKLGLVGAAVLAIAIIPFTGWMLPFMGKFLSKSLWLYQ